MREAGRREGYPRVPNESKELSSEELRAEASKLIAEFAQNLNQLPQFRASAVSLFWAISQVDNKYIYPHNEKPSAKFWHKRYLWEIDYIPRSEVMNMHTLSIKRSRKDEKQILHISSQRLPEGTVRSGSISFYDQTGKEVNNTKALGKARKFLSQLTNPKRR